MKSKITSIVICIVGMAIILYVQSTSETIAGALACTIGALFFFSILVRGNIRFKQYFTSKYNFLTSKLRQQSEFDMPKDLLFDKMKEVLSESGFRLQYADEATGTLFATSKMSFFSWGENIYVDMKNKDGVTVVDFCSACIFGAASWGRNEKNYKHLLDTFEKSLII